MMIIGTRKKIDDESVPGMVALPPPSSFAAVAPLLKKSAAVRTEDDLRQIVAALEPALAADAVWAALSPRQKRRAGKHLELTTAFEDGGDVWCVEKGRVAGARRDDPPPCGLCILVRGRATIAHAGRSLVVHGGDGGTHKLRMVLGRLSVPSGDAREFFKRGPAIEGKDSLYHRFVPPKRGREGDVTARFERGSTYIVLPETQSRRSLGRLDASLVAMRVLGDLEMATLLRKRTHNRHCARAAPLEGVTRATWVFPFWAGHILLREGDAPDRILLVATGSCLILRSDKEQEFRCVGSLAAPCFVGISPFFGGGDHGGKGADGGAQPVTVVAATDGHAFLFCPNCFLTALDNDSTSDATAGECTPKSRLVLAFQSLARSQMEAWALRPGIGEAACEEEEALVTHDAVAEDDDDEFWSEFDQGQSEADPGQKRLIEKLRAAQEKEILEMKMRTENSKMPIDVDSKISKGKLNRSKFLAAIHETFSDNCMAVTEPSPFVDNREKWLLEGDKSNVLRDTIAALSKGCGADATAVEDNDPFHNFAVDAPLGTDGDLRMSLQKPPLMPNRLERMATTCLGRKRPPEYDDSDPFLKPHPSMVSRKLHGKTLPIVRRNQEGL